MQSPSQTDNNTFSTNSFLIAVIITIFFLSLFGINPFFLLGVIFNFFKGIVMYVLSFFTYVTGFFIYKTADVVKDTSKVGIDITGDAVGDVGKIMMDASKTKKVKLDDSLKKKENYSNYTENSTDNPIQTNKKQSTFSNLDTKDKYITCQFDPTSALCLNTKSG
jgi:hypothetical protein